MFKKTIEMKTETPAVLSDDELDRVAGGTKIKISANGEGVDAERRNDGRWGHFQLFYDTF